MCVYGHREAPSTILLENMAVVNSIIVTSGPEWQLKSIMVSESVSWSHPPLVFSVFRHIPGPVTRKQLLFVQFDQLLKIFYRFNLLGKKLLFKGIYTTVKIYLWPFMVAPTVMGVQGPMPGKNRYLHGVTLLHMLRRRNTHTLFVFVFV